jgi:hypothetical protein
LLPGTRLWGLLLCSVLAACGSIPREVHLQTPAPELTETPFFAQTAHHCGPAAAATVLMAAGIPATPDELAARVYLPARRGSLQAEMVAVMRAHGGIPMEIAPQIEALTRELRAGRPVLVLQNLGLRRLPVWHYAVVVGVEPAADRVILRSGRTRRQQLSGRRFMDSWAMAGHWGIVVLRPGELPADADPKRYLRAVAGLEAVGAIDAAARGYEAALVRWPAEPVALLGLANTDYARGRYRAAIAGYRALLRLDPENAVARNNRAEALAALDCHDEALAELSHALAMPELNPLLRARLTASRDHLLARAQAAGNKGCRSAQ